MKKLFPILIIVLCFCNLAFATDYYVDKDSIGGSCSDSNAGTSLSSPWCTITKANSTLSAGDTAYIRIGTYTTSTDGSIQPSNNGSAGNYIVYQNYNSESVTITGSGYGAYLSSKNYMKIDGISFYETESSWIYFDDVDYSVIQNCTFQHSEAYTGLIIANDSEYNQILDNTFNTSPASGDANGTFPADHMRVGHYSTRDSNYNLIQGNTFNRTGHAGLAIYSQYNVVRDNLFQNQYHTGLGLAYTDQLVENNYFYDQGNDYENDPIPSADRLGNPGIQMSWANHIVRNNIFDNNGSSMLMYSTSTSDDPSNVRIYNNTMNKAVRVLYGAADNVEGYSDCILKNNIITNAFDGGGGGARDDPAQIYYYYKNGSGHEWYNNNVYGTYDANRYTQDSAYPMTFAYILSNYSSEWISGNIAVDPKYADEENRDFTLQYDSGLIDAGAWLTTITSSTGSGTTFAVDDAGYFYDGWGIPGETGDVIKTEGGETATITDITGNTITVDSSISWTENEGIALDYVGSSPDIGAEEYELQVFSVFPVNDNTGISITANASWDYVSSVDGVELWLDLGACDGSPDDAEACNPDNNDCTGDESSGDTDKIYDMSTLDTDTVYCLTLLAYDGSVQGDFQQFEFTTAGGPPQAEGNLGQRKYSPYGRFRKYSPYGLRYRRTK